MRNLKVGTGLISALVYRPDGSALVALDVDHPTTRARVYPFPDGAGKKSVAVYGARFAVAPDGRRAAAVTFSSLRVWTLADGVKHSFQPQGRGGFLYGVGFPADGSHVLVSGQLPGDNGARQLIAWDPDARRAAWALECAAGEQIATAGDRTATAGAGEAGFYRLKSNVLVVEAGRVVREMRLAQREIRGGVRRVRFSPDGSLLGVAYGRNVLVWDVATGDEVHRLTGHKRTVQDVAFSPDGRLVATGGDDDRVKFWDAGTGRLVTTFAWRIDVVGSLAFSPDGLTCAAGGTKGRVVVWDVDE
ncbi:MAG TPA: WD40 repeat domain-containing protein [Gemmataceae bacterium]|jgi:WD40 repeat protein|nr:WD40 repeat domain-containing protein [Gemmataceae bacterium]